jgi:anti-anti-sigma factor
MAEQSEPPPAPFVVRRHEHGTTLVVEVQGEIDLSTADGVRQATGAPASAPQRLVLDLRGVGFMDTSGIRLVVELMHAEEAGGPELSLVADHRPVLRLFDMAGLTPRLRLARSVDEALG